MEYTLATCPISGTTGAQDRQDRGLSRTPRGRVIRWRGPFRTTRFRLARRFAPPRGSAHSSLHLLRLRSDTGLRTTIVPRDAFPVHHDADHHDNAPVLTLGRTPPHGPRRRGPASRLPCATRRRGPSPRLRTGPSSHLRVAFHAPRQCPDTARLAASGDIGQLMPSASLRSPSATPPGSAVRSASESFARHRLPHFAILYCPFHCQRLCKSLRQCARHHRSVCPLGIPRLTPSGSGANDDDTDRPPDDLVRASVFNTLPRPNVPTTTRQPLGSSPPATSPRSRHPPRYARRRRRRSRPRRWRWLPIIIASGDAVHVHDPADHRDDVHSVPVTTTAATPVNVPVMTIIARQLHRSAYCTSRPLAAPLRDRTACRARPVPCSPRRCGLRPSSASALRHPVLSIPLSPPSAPLPEPPTACSAPMPSVPSALPATQSPWRLPPASFARLYFPSLIPRVCRS